MDIFLSISLGATVYFARPDALKGTIVETLNEVKPTSFLGVPRVWEKMQEKIESMTKGARKIENLLSVAFANCFF